MALVATSRFYIKFTGKKYTAFFFIGIENVLLKAVKLYRLYKLILMFNRVD